MTHKLFKSTFIVSFMILLSRILGFVRDMIFATIFGATPGFDAFVVAFKIPNFLRRLFGEGAFSQAFVPVLAEYRSRQSQDQVKAFVNHITGCLSAALLVIVVVAELFTPLVVRIFAPGFVHDPQRFHDAAYMLHITFPYILLIALAALAGAVLNTYNRFASASFTPILLNVVLISVAWWWSPHAKNPVYALAWGVLAGGVVQLIAQVVFLIPIDMFPRPKLSWKDPGVKRVMKQMVPALFGVSVAQISLLVDNFFASFLVAGSISWLYYSDRFTYLPLALIGVALATVVLPNLARHHSTNSSLAYSATLDWALRIVVLIGIPAAVAMLILAGPLLVTLINHGVFGVHDVLMTQRSLWAFSLGLPSFMFIKVLASAFYSKQNIRTPVKIAVIAVAANLILNILLIKPLAHAGLALSTSLASWLNGILLLVLLLRKKMYTPQPGWSHLLVSVILANIVMGLLLSICAGHLANWFQWGLWQRVLRLLITMSAGLLAYFACLLVLGLRFKHFRVPAAASHE